MDNLQDKTKRNTNSEGETVRLRPDPIVQAKDDSSRPHEVMPSTEIVHSTNKPISVADATLLPNQFMGMGEPTQAVQSGNDIIQSMFRFKWMILAIFILVAAPAIAAIWTQIVPEYRARAEVQVRPIIPYLVFRTEDSGTIPLYSSFVNTQASIVRSSVVLQRVLDQQEVKETQWCKEPPKPLVQRLLGNPLDPNIERLRNGLSVRPRKETEIIDVTFIDPSAEDARIIVDVVLDQYIKYVGEKSDATKDALYRQLVDQYKSLDNEIKGLEMVSAGLTRELRTGTPQELVSGERVRLASAQARFNELRQSIDILEWERKELYIKYIGEMSNVTKDEFYSKLIDQYNSLGNEIKGQEMIFAELSRSLGTGTPQELISGKRVRLDETQARLSKLRQSIAVLEWKRKELYIKYIGEMSNATKDELCSKLAEQHKSLDDEIKGQEVISAELSRALDTGTPQELISDKRVRLDSTQARLSELRRSIAVLEWERKKLEDLMKQVTTDDSNDVLVASTVTMEKQPKYYEDAEWRKLDIVVRTHRHNIENSLLSPNHPNAIRAAKDMKFAEGLLLQREAQLNEQWRDRPVNAAGVPITVTDDSGPDYKEELRTLEYQLARTKYEEQFLLPELKDQNTKFQELFEDAQLLEKENNALQHKRELLNTVRQRLDQKTMERNVPGSIDVLTWASVSSKPYNDRRIVLTATALFLGLGIGGGIAFLRASRNQAIYTHKDMPHPMQVPFLGYIPVTRTRRSSDAEVSPAMIESIRFVRTTLLSRLDGQGSTTILVTSADVGTGKSTFTMMLGKSLAQAGKNVLMIDADFRKMALTKRFNLPDKSGFLESLYCKSVDKRHIFPTETFGLSIMPAGKRGNDDIVFEETANGAFNACIGQLRKQYNIILLDSSPILPVADATILSSQVDGTIMVERELVSQRANVIEALARLGSAGGRLLGTVFVGSGGHEGYGYSYHYSRISES